MNLNMKMDEIMEKYREPRNFEEESQLAALQFDVYRRKGDNPAWDTEKVYSTAPLWLNVRLPMAGPNALFDNVEPAEVFWVKGANNHANLNRNSHLMYPASERLYSAREYFEDEFFSFQKPLGYGGLGLALHFRYMAQSRTPKDVVVKLSLSGWYSDSILREAKATRKMFRAAHCIQMIHPQDVRRAEPDVRPIKPRPDDSSDESNSSGDESVSEQHRPLVRVPRRFQDTYTKKLKDYRYQKRVERWKARQNRDLSQVKDYMLLEYVEGGNLQRLIGRLRAKSRPEVTDGVVALPNRVLWEIWLCLVRACVAMKYPPRKFHPGRPKPPRPPMGVGVSEAEIMSSETLRRDPANIKYLLDMSMYRTALSFYESAPADLIEGVPPENKRWRAKNIVHFDIDPTNIFIASSEPRRGTGVSAREHLLVPRLKLADFGIATNIKTHKRNEYYYYQRWTGKSNFLAPEQFCAEWNNVQPVRDGIDVGEGFMAGNYGSATNIWGIALTMWVIITQMNPPQPPQPQVPYGIDVPSTLYGVDDAVDKAAPGVAVSYCALLLDEDGGFDRVDPELRRVIYECMYHRPTDRPRVEDLLEQALRGVQKSFPGEDDDTIRAWVNEFFYDAPTGPDA